MNDQAALLLGLALGFSAGFACAWWYFLAEGLIRSRREYYAARRDRGLKVPEDWEEDR